MKGKAYICLDDIPIEKVAKKYEEGMIMKINEKKAYAEGFQKGFEKAMETALVSNLASWWEALEDVLEEMGEDNVVD